MAKIKYPTGTGYEPVDARYGEAISDGVLTITPTQVGNVNNLQTTNKTLVSAINEVKTNAGDNLRNQMNENRRELAHLLAYAEIDNRALGNTGKFYDLFDGYNFVSSSAKLDTFKASTQAALGIGTTTATLDTVTGLSVGMEVTLFDDVNFERPIIKSINTSTKVVTFVSALTKSYKINATLCRSSVFVDTVSKLMKFGGWESKVTNSITTPINVVGARYDVSGNGKKVTMLPNGDIVAVANNSGTIRLYKWSYTTGTFNSLCYVSGATIGCKPAIESIGTDVYLTFNDTTRAYLVIIDTTTVTNSDRNSTKSVIDTVTSFTEGITLARNKTGTVIWFAAISKVPAYPDSSNIRAVKGNVNSNGTVTWDSATQVTTNNNINANVFAFSMVVLSNDNPLILASCRGFYYNAGTLTISNGINSMSAIIYKNGSWSTFYNVKFDTNLLFNPDAIVASNGEVHLAWYAFDSTNQNVSNIFYAKSSNATGEIWGAAQKITNESTNSQEHPVITIDKNNTVYIVFHGTDSAISASYTNIRKISYTTTWSAVTTLTNNTTNHANYPAVVSNHTDYTDPLIIWMDWPSNSVKFRGVWTGIGAMPLLVEDVRYNITANAGNINELVAFVQRQYDAGLNVSGRLSIVSSSANENYLNMTKKTITIDSGTREDQFVGEVATANTKATLCLTLNRTSTGINKGLKLLLGATS